MELALVRQNTARFMTDKPTQANKPESKASPAKPVPEVYDYDTLLKKVKAGYRRAREFYAANPRKTRFGKGIYHGETKDTEGTSNEGTKGVVR